MAYLGNTLQMGQMGLPVKRGPSDLLGFLGFLDSLDHKDTRESQGKMRK